MELIVCTSGVEGRRSESNFSHDWKILTVHPAGNGYLITIGEGLWWRKERIGQAFNHFTLLKTQWGSLPRAARLIWDNFTFYISVILYSDNTELMQPPSTTYFRPLPNLNILILCLIKILTNFVLIGGKEWREVNRSKAYQVMDVHSSTGKDGCFSINTHKLHVRLMFYHCTSSKVMRLFYAQLN